MPISSFVDTGIFDAFEITTDVPVAAYQINPFGAHAANFPGASLLLPTSVWDTNYVAVNAFANNTTSSPAGVPLLPGYHGAEQDSAFLEGEAKRIGFPLVIKAVSGGGGRGMRVVRAAADFADALQSARQEGASAFGDDRVLIERYLERPRHIEVQVFGDSHGNAVHLFERDCSAQRRHQKVIEEAPAPGISAKMRDAMGAAAVAAAKAVKYQGAGTVEFIAQDGGFYFLEMNTRLQVEHPVTELITGLDLVALQIAVAQGELLGLEQADIKLEGHAIEVRLYTEDPSQDFLPASGPVELWQPATGVGVRIDSGICSGQGISPFYDPMVAKVIGYGPTREVARLRLIAALKETVLFGTTNNLRFLTQCLEKQQFIDGLSTTAFIAEEFSDTDLADPLPAFADAAVAAVLALQLEHRGLFQRALGVSEKLKNWTSASPLVSRKQYQFDDLIYDLCISPEGKEGYRVSAMDPLPAHNERAAQLAWHLVVRITGEVAERPMQ